jgi:TolB-like protein
VTRLRLKGLGRIGGGVRNCRVMFSAQSVLLPTLIIFALLGQPAISQAAGKRLAVLEFKGGSIKNEVLDAFADAVRGGAVDGLVGRGVQVMTRENMMVLLRDMGKKDCSEGDCEVETARNIGADFVVSGSVVFIDNTFVVTLKLHETQGGSLLATDRVEAKSQIEVLHQLSEHSRKLVAGYIGPHPAPSVTQAQPPSVPEPRIPAQPAQASGEIYIAADGPGKVTVDGQYKGSLPLDLTNQVPGTYRIRVELDDGTTDERDIEVGAGQIARVHIGSSPDAVAAVARKGSHFGFEIGGGPWLLGGGGTNSPGKFFGSGGGFLNLGLNPTVDFRVGLRLQIWSVGLLAFPVSFRFNIGSVYSITLGANMGYRWAHYFDGSSSFSERGLFLGPEISLLNFRFGRKGQFEVAAVQGLAWPMTTNLGDGHKGVIVLYNTFAFSMLF